MKVFDMGKHTHIFSTFTDVAQPATTVDELCAVVLEAKTKFEAERLRMRCAFTEHARQHPCSACGHVSTMNEHGDIIVCQHVFDAFRENAHVEVCEDSVSPLFSVRVYVQDSDCRWSFSHYRRRTGGSEGERP